jgi:SnoaL-like domain
MNMDTVDARLARLADRVEITDLVYRLGVVLDEHGFERMGSLLTDDVTASTPGGTSRGQAAVIAQAERIHTTAERIHHVITDVLVDFDEDGDRARVRANLLVHFAPAEAPSGAAVAPTVTCTQGQVYRLDAVRTTDGWRLSTVETSPVWMSGARP